jgi:hypothetical protein
MTHIPDGVMQVTPYPFPLQSLPGCRSVSDDDLCAWCMQLLYRPGEHSLCRLSTDDGHWPSRCDEDGYVQSCPSLRLNHAQSDN